MRIRRSFGVLLIGSMLLVGCGGDDDNASSGSDADAPTGSTARDATGNTTDGAAIDSARCAGAATAMAQAAAALPQAVAGTTQGIQASVAQFEAFADAAPSEIKNDLRTVAAGYADLVKVLSDANYDPASGQPPSPEVQARIRAATEDLEDSDFLEAANRVTAWFQDGCKT